MYIQAYLPKVVVPAVEMEDPEMKLLEEFAEQNFKKELDEIRTGVGAAKPRHQNPANRKKTLKKAGFNHSRLWQ